MDQIDANFEVTNLICATLLFIHEVSKECLAGSTITPTFIATHAFLETFSELCFSDVTGILRDARVPQVLLQDVRQSLHVLNKSLAAHREAWRYVSVASQVKRQETVKISSTISTDINGQKQRWRDEMKQRSQIWKERAARSANSALFEVKEMESLSSACSAWVCRLRHTLELVLLVAGEVSPHYPTYEQSSKLGITHMLEKPRRLGLKLSESYQPLNGQLRKSIGNAQPGSGLMKTVYSRHGNEADVMVEVRCYSDAPAGAVSQLTWYLSSSTPLGEHEIAPTSERGYQMLTLRCLGYIDDPSNARAMILYRSPKSHPWASSPPTLHDTIAKGWLTKPSLGHRFQCARTLAASVLDIHTSGSLHSNINSRSITMLPRKLNDVEPSPYLVGWGAEARSSTGAAPLERNLYRHNSQFGQSLRELTTEQDIYSLAVVLLELGLWTTMSTVFAKLLETTPRFGAREETALFKKVNRVILDLAYSIDLRREMGKRYSEVVKKCLEWSQDDAVESMLEFRKQVVDALDVGCGI
ncbi:hypothetical protein EK21DRAFT_112456 [Setomelanomma holmii]|uniref:Protein kinase domain-containing protein n=1 Tax=Setomelanomma holmii TaxID=210430 RepID=A0A9P4HAQ6_9PLEO|nr:hypothetical protein EK21DRAFT_112456 [Setomelanomma holmii]